MLIADGQKMKFTLQKAIEHLTVDQQLLKRNFAEQEDGGYVDLMQESAADGFDQYK